MTQLQTVKHHHISLHCRCGHGALISIKSLLETLPPETTVHMVATKAKCKKCDARVVRILGYIGSVADYLMDP